MSFKKKIFKKIYSKKIIGCTASSYAMYVLVVVICNNLHLTTFNKEASMKRPSAVKTNFRLILFKIYAARITMVTNSEKSNGNIVFSKVHKVENCGQTNITSRVTRLIKFYRYLSTYIWTSVV